MVDDSKAVVFAATRFGRNKTQARAEVKSAKAWEVGRPGHMVSGAPGGRKR